MPPATTVAEPATLADVVHALGGVPLDRILWTPRPGTATEADLFRIRAAGSGGRLELVDGVLVEKPMGVRESYLAFTLMYFLGAYQRTHNIGVFGAPDSLMRLQPELLRVPDVHFTSWANLPSDAAHLRPVADYPPDLAIEILSESDRPGMVARKRGNTSPPGPGSSGSSTRSPGRSPCTPTRPTRTPTRPSARPTPWPANPSCPGSPCPWPTCSTTRN